MSINSALLHGNQAVTGFLHDHRQVSSFPAGSFVFESLTLRSLLHGKCDSNPSWKQH